MTSLEMANSSLFDTGHGIRFSMAAGMEDGNLGNEGCDPGDEGCDSGDEGHDLCNKGHNLGDEVSIEWDGPVVDDSNAGMGEDETVMGDVSAGTPWPVLDNVTRGLDSKTGWAIRAFITTSGLESNIDLCRMVWPFNGWAGVLGMRI